MQTAKVFQTGRSQAVRLPKECRFDVDEVCAHRIEDMVILFPRKKGWRVLQAGLDLFTADYLGDRNQPKRAEERRRL